VNIYLRAVLIFVVSCRNRLGIYIGTEFMNAYIPASK